MRIIEVGGNKYIDQDLYNYINNIWLNYDVEIAGDSNVYFMKNTTVNRLITDYCGKEIRRVIKREKADYVVINRFGISDYAQFYDGTNISDDDTKEVVYGVYNESMEIQDTIELILDFVNRKQEVKYVNQDGLNDSLNNGFVIDKDNYTTIKELVDSPHIDNHELAINMLIQSNLKENWQWILYLYHEKITHFNYDKKNIICNYITNLKLGYSLTDYFRSIDKALLVVNNKDVQDRFICLVKDRFQKNIQSYFRETIKTETFNLKDFKIEWNVK